MLPQSRGHLPLFSCWSCQLSELLLEPSRGDVKWYKNIQCHERAPFTACSPMTSFLSHFFPQQKDFILLILTPVCAGDSEKGVCVCVCVCVYVHARVRSPRPRRSREILRVPFALPSPGLGVFPLTYLKPGIYISLWILDTLCFLPFFGASLRSLRSLPWLSFSTSWVSVEVVSLKPTVTANL